MESVPNRPREQQTVTQIAPRTFTYNRWMESTGIPIHKGYYLEDLRTMELGWWKERQCRAAFIQLMGQEGVTSSWVTEIPPGTSLLPTYFALDEVVYVVEGRGVTTAWPVDGKSRKTFEWQRHSLFLLPHNYHRQLSNMQGDKPVRLLHYSYLPIAMSAVPEPLFFFNNPYRGPFYFTDEETDVYSQARLLQEPSGTGRWKGRIFWYSSFFPDMKAWDKLEVNSHRGAGGKSVFIQFPNSEMSAHMSVFPPRTYKKAHRHGPGRVIVILEGEGYSVMWQEGKEKVVIPWHECSAFVPPNKWFHQHFNVGSGPARYLALQPPRQFSGGAEKIQDKSKDIIEYPDEEPWIREKFENHLRNIGLKSLVPEEAYRNKDYQWPGTVKE
jgi:quercetin dioxygenase-like cupin family protein